MKLAKKNKTSCEFKKKTPLLESHSFLPSSSFSSSLRLDLSSCPHSTCWSSCSDWRCSHMSSDVGCEGLKERKLQISHNSLRRKRRREKCIHGVTAWLIYKPFMLSWLFKAPWMTACASSFLVFRASIVSRISTNSESCTNIS